MTPRVSIIVPCYNAEAWVDAALDSAFGQSWPDLEVIVINDGSTDRSLEVLGRRTDPRLRIIDQPNRGASAARNAGLRAATGDFVQFLDADDLLAPGKVAAQVARLAGAPLGSVASGSWSRFYSKPVVAPPAVYPLAQDFTPVGYVTANLKTGEMMHPAAWLVPAPVAARAGPWDERLSLNDDGEYFARVVLASAGVLYVPDAVSYYRSGVPGSLSRRKDRKALESLALSFELCAQHLLAAEDGPQVRATLADHFQRLVYETYPGAPNLSRRAAARAADFGGSTLRPQMGRRQAAVSRILGWKLTSRLRDWLRH